MAVSPRAKQVKARKYTRIVASHVESKPLLLRLCCCCCLFVATAASTYVAAPVAVAAAAAFAATIVTAVAVAFMCGRTRLLHNGGKP